jgi:hypothetical protein
MRFEGAFQPRPDATELQQVADLLGPDNSQRAKFEGDGSFVFRPRPGKASDGGPDYFVFISAEDEGQTNQIQRTWFALYQPTAPIRGVALLMPGLFGTPVSTLEMFTTRLRAQGWAVVRMMSQPSRFTERVTFDVDLANIPAAAERIARATDDLAGECGFAVKAAFEYVGQQHPELANLPRIAVGMSGGAMTLPTVVAREPGKYAAAVIIAGGADFFAITRETNYTFLVDSVHFQWKPAEPTDDQIKALDAAYLARANLDSYHTADALRGKQVLMIHGDHDLAVPAHLGDLLWERLGKPERWVSSAGHEEVFMRLPLQMDRLMAWIDEHTRAAAPASR